MRSGVVDFNRGLGESQQQLEASSALLGQWPPVRTFSHASKKHRKSAQSMLAASGYLAAVRCNRVKLDTSWSVIVAGTPAHSCNVIPLMPRLRMKASIQNQSINRYQSPRRWTLTTAGLSASNFETGCAHVLCLSGLPAAPRHTVRLQSASLETWRNSTATAWPILAAPSGSQSIASNTSIRILLQKQRGEKTFCDVGRHPLTQPRILPQCPVAKVKAKVPTSGQSHFLPVW